MATQMTRLRILLLEDNQNDFLQIREMIDKINACTTHDQLNFFAHNAVELVWIKNRTVALDLLSRERFDLILTALTLPDSQGVETVSKLHKRSPQTPIIALADSIEKDVSMEAMRSGAQDYLVKRQFACDYFARSIRYAVERGRIQKEVSDVADHKNQFIANVSHEIRTPLTAILGFADIIQRKMEPDSDLSAASAAIVRNARHILSLIDDVLDLSKIEAGKLPLTLQQCSLSSIIWEVEQMMSIPAREKGLTFIAVPEGKLPKVIYTDPVRIKQVLINLIDNAIKYTPKGSVRLRTSFLENTGEIEFSVTDSGIGMSPVQQEKLFKPFSQGDPAVAREYGGSGLGLALSRQIAELLGGTIKVKSVLGEGSTFTVFVPRVTSVIGDSVITMPPPSAPVKSETKNDILPLPQGKILIVDDAPDNQELLVYLLKETGLETKTVDDGAAALTVAGLEKFDAILMDMHMPVMDGIEATRQLRAHGYDKPIIALTAKVGPKAQAECMAAGCNDYISKPFEQSELIRVLRSVMDLTSETANGNGSHPFAAINNEKYRQIALSFLNRLPYRMTAIKEAFNNKNFPILERSAHLLANADMFGFTKISDLARELEQAAENEAYDLCSESVSNLEDLCGKISQEYMV